MVMQIFPTVLAQALAQLFMVLDPVLHSALRKSPGKGDTKVNRLDCKELQISTS